MALLVRILLVLVTAAILYLSLVPAPPGDGLGWDKANHAVTMAFVSVLAWLAARPARRAVAFGGLYGLLLGGVIELLQGTLTSGRTAEWGDLAADAIGVAVATLLVKILKKSTAFPPFLG